MSKALDLLTLLKQTEDQEPPTDVPVPREPAAQHIPVVLLLDTSSSMNNSASNGRSRIDMLNEYLTKFLSDIANGVHSDLRTRADITIITYDSTVDVALQWTHGSDLEPSHYRPMVASGVTSMNRAIAVGGQALLDLFRHYGKENIKTHCAHVFNFTDGMATDHEHFEDAKKVINFYEHAGSNGAAYAKFFHVGVGEYDEGALRRLSPEEDRVSALGDKDIADFFDFIIATLGGISGHEGSTILDIIDSTDDDDD